MRSLALLALISLLAPPRHGHAQHASMAAGTAVGPGNGCAVCHTSHPGRTGTHTLILDRDMSDRTAWLQHQATGVTAVTLSCLRCHTSAAVRQQQPEFALRGTTAPERAFLGVDLGDDHFLGAFDPLITPLSRRTRDPTDPRAAPRSVAILGDTALVIECTTCHDPHDRLSATPDAGRQRLVCGSCHDLAAYLDRHHPGQACSACHAVHGSTQPALLAGRGPEETCGRCHGGLGAPSRDAGFDRLLMSSGPRIPLSDDHRLSTDCLDCHAAHLR